MLHLLLIYLCCMADTVVLGAPAPPVRILFWNVENFFDYFDGGASDSDREFSARGARHWSKRRFLAKCQTLAKSIFWIADKTGGMPDIIALARF